MALNSLFIKLADIFDGDLEIEQVARHELRSAAANAKLSEKQDLLRPPFLQVMHQTDAHPICADILKTPFNWAPPETSHDDLYVQHSVFKSHVELLGPDGLAKSNIVRVGFYGMLPNSEYGIRTHPAEEIYIMLAGDCLWKVGNAPYRSLTVSERSHHPSNIRHATKTQANAFMSIYVWYGDLSTEQYKYQGLTDA